LIPFELINAAGDEQRRQIHANQSLGPTLEQLGVSGPQAPTNKPNIRPVSPMVGRFMSALNASLATLKPAAQEDPYGGSRFLMGRGGLGNLLG
jgi:hypothetical protein